MSEELQLNRDSKPNRDSKANRDSPGGQQPNVGNLIDSICDSFEAAWLAGQSPLIEDYVQRVGDPDRPRLLKELLLLELSLLCENGQSADEQQYLSRFAGARETVRDAFRASAAETPTMSMVDLANALTLDQTEPVSRPLAELQQSATEQQFGPGDYLIRQGEDANSLIVIREGMVEIRVQDDDSSATHVIDRAGPGQVLGEMSLLTQETRTASAVALGEVRAAVLTAESFHQLATQQPDLSDILTALIAERLGNRQHDALTGKQLDRYRVQRRLGRGGMAVVYEATDTTDGQRVALKMMSHRLVCSKEALARFQLEADLIERFHHPNIVSMLRRFEAFRTYFIVMEFCVGETLSSFIRREGPMNEATFRNHFGQLVKAIRHAHERGIIHRDIKPANVMRLADGTVKLMDFGLAEPVAGSHSTGEVVGTPRYMAPEQRTGGKLDRQVDYFALGCVAYEMLVGKPLFRGDPASEVSREFKDWQPPDFQKLDVPLSKETATALANSLIADPQQRELDLDVISDWAP